MSCLITNLPSYEVWVRKEYLTDHQSGHGENLSKEFGYLLSQYLAVPFTLKHTYLSMLQCLISCPYPRFSRHLSYQTQI